MNQGARDANHQADVYAVAKEAETQIALLKEIRDLLRMLVSKTSVG